MGNREIEKKVLQYLGKDNNLSKVPSSILNEYIEECEVEINKKYTDFSWSEIKMFPFLELVCDERNNRMWKGVGF